LTEVSGIRGPEFYYGHESGADEQDEDADAQLEPATIAESCVHGIVEFRRAGLMSPDERALVIADASAAVKYQPPRSGSRATKGCRSLELASTLNANFSIRTDVKNTPPQFGGRCVPK
jgi:hypothetical protein